MNLTAQEAQDIAAALDRAIDDLEYAVARGNYDFTDLVGIDEQITRWEKLLAEVAG